MATRGEGHPSIDPRDERGQGLAEYALIVVLIAILSILILTAIGFQLSTTLSQIGDSV